jgi:hypothetical protein
MAEGESCPAEPFRGKLGRKGLVLAQQVAGAWKWRRPADGGSWCVGTFTVPLGCLVSAGEGYVITAPGRPAVAATVTAVLPGRGDDDAPTAYFHGGPCPPE